VQNFDTVWEQVLETAVSIGLDPTKFNQSHQEIVAHIIEFLQQAPVEPNATDASNGKLRQKLSQWFSQLTAENDDQPKPPAPLIICGQPGTGKTTFLNVLDIVLRRAFALPDNIQPVMQKEAYQYSVSKRFVCGQPISLLSVKKWAGLLHFYAWNRDTHGLVPADRTNFIQNSLLPMRLIFADEVEMTGYSPTIPQLTQHGLLVIGTSNQHQFAQLEADDMPPHVYTFSGVDLRAGSPADAVVLPTNASWALFDRLKELSAVQYEQLTYRTLRQEGLLFVWLDFETAVNAPLLENDWANFLQTVGHIPTAPLILLLDDFSLEILRVNYNAIIRFVSLFDLIEQQGMGVLLRNQQGAAALSRAALSHMKVTIHAARGVSEEVKARTTVGIDRCTSRIGQAGHKAQALLSKLG